MRSDDDQIETKEWLDALKSVIRHEGQSRAQYLLETLLQHGKDWGLSLETVASLKSLDVNTLAPMDPADYPGDLKKEAELEAAIRWNAIAMVCRAKAKAGGVGGHLSSYASIATLYEVGLNHFFRGRTPSQLGDLVYFQGHSSEGNYARAYLEGRITKDQLESFRQEINQPGLSSYPHPWLMPDFWQFATVSLGLGLLQGIYQARLLRYLDHRQLLKESGRRVWVFCGDGEMDEPESIAGLTMAAREKLDQLILVVNANLQRLDGLVRANSKIISELEGLFRGAGWRVIKVLWNSQWDALFAKDKKGVLAKRLAECVDGDLQSAYVKGAEYTRDFIFNSDELKQLIDGWSLEDIAALNRGAHDPLKIYAAYQEAMKQTGQPTVILTLGVKGYGLGTKTTEGRNVAHNQLDMTAEELTAFRDRFHLPLTDKQLSQFDYVQPSKEALAYLKARRDALGGYLPHREVQSNVLSVPALESFASYLQGSPDRAVSTTMVLARMLSQLLKDANIGKRMVPIFSDEVRTFGMESLFRQVGIYASTGQLYTPEDKEQFLFYNESQSGQVLEEGITEAGCMASWIAAATAYATHNYPLIPIFTYYSMFGFQRVGDLIWAAGDMRARGFLIGATAGRTTLEGEGLQHQDGTSLLMAAHVPNCRAYDPAFGYEMAVIMQQGLQTMFAEEQDVFYYIMAMNEKYHQPAMPAGVEEGIIRGMYCFKKGGTGKYQVQLLGSGAILNEVIAAQTLLAEEFDVAADVYSVTSYAELKRDGMTVARHNRLHPANKPQSTYVANCLSASEGPIIAASDYVKAYAELIRPYLPSHRSYYTLGTDGFGRSDTREALRSFFEVDRFHIVVTALYGLMEAGKLKASVVEKAMKQFNIRPDKPNPETV